MALLLDGSDVQDTGMEEHELKTAPLFTRDAYKSLGRTREDGQYGVLGRILSIQYVIRCTVDVCHCAEIDESTERCACPRRTATVREYGTSQRQPQLSLR